MAKKSGGLGYADGVTYRANLRGDPIRDNPTVHSKGMENAAKAGFKPSDPRNGAQPAKLYGRDLPSGIHSKDAHSPGKPVRTQVGHATDGSGKYTQASFPNTAKVADGIHKPGTESKPSGRTITK